MIDNATWTIGDRLKRSRQMAGMNQTVIAGRLGVSRPTVSDWEIGRTMPSAVHFIRWAQITGATLDWLAEGLNAESPTLSRGASDEVVHPLGLEPRTH
ncbi:helix-turn-helix domain-containing protein [Mycetocola reblochoni]|uniref:helix-turn-helix domain-containing protein n=1 Tax=Mycetocola reblochoni TaxID=331618 RepID=UPI003F9961F1